MNEMVMMTLFSHRPSGRPLRGACTSIGILLALGIASAGAATIDFGERSLSVPNPSGFEPVTKTAPRYIEASQAYLPKGNRLVEAYVPAVAATALADGRKTPIERYFQLQALRQAEGVPVSTEDFAALSGEAEADLGATFEHIAGTAKQLTDDGNAHVKEMTANDPGLTISGIKYFGVFRREPWGLFFTVTSHVATPEGTQGDELIGASALVLIDYQLVYLYAYAHNRSPEDRRWAEQAVSAWADNVRAANPDEPAVAASFNSEGAGLRRLLGIVLAAALVAGLAGLFVFVLRKRSV